MTAAGGFVTQPAVRNDDPDSADFGEVVRVAGTVTVVTGTTTGTLGNGAEVVVGAAAVQVLAANATAKARIVQNTGSANIRVGALGVTATTGLQLVPGASAVFGEPHVPTNAIYAIREGAVSSVALGQEVT